MKTNVEIPVTCTADKKEVYVSASEVNTFDIKIKDDSGKTCKQELKEEEPRF